MTLFDLTSYQLAFVFLINTVVLVASIGLVVEAANIKVYSKFFAYGVCLFVLSFLSLQVLAEIGRGQVHLAGTLVHLPLFLFVLYLLLVGILEVILVIHFIQTNRRVIGKNSIKESMDNLPDGICFSKMDGTPLLVNRVMQDISYAVFGNMLANDLTCAQDIQANRIKKEARILQREPLVIEALGDIWQIKLVVHENIRETLAYKITLEWGLYQEIQEKNRQIEKINASLKDYQKNVAEYTRQKEILQAKIKIHDKIGQCLIYFKRYLDMDPKTQEDRDKLISLWMESLVILEEREDFLDQGPDSSKYRSRFQKLISTAKDIGVEVHVAGEIPSQEGDLKLLVEIVHEALNNAIRHGRAKNIWIDLDQDDLEVYCRIKNDGVLAKKSIVEKGGLKNIRQRVQACGGKMEIQMDSHFILDLAWPKGGNYDL